LIGGKKNKSWQKKQSEEEKNGNSNKMKRMLKKP
jgi:hypothetical protein